jgi:hypothetical protein
MLTMKGRGRVALWEPQDTRPTTFGPTDIWIMGDVVHYIHNERYMTVPMIKCEITWEEAPVIAGV